MRLAKIPWFEVIFSFSFGALATWLTFTTGSWMFLIMALLTLGAGVLYVQRNGWAHLVTAALFAFLVFGVTLPGIINDGMTVRQGLVAAGCGWGFWSQISIWRRLRREASIDQSMTSMVLLLDQPASIDALGFQAVLNRAWGIEAEISEGDDQTVPESEADKPMHMILGAPPHLLLFSNFRLWALHCVPNPYWKNPDEVAEGCLELRTAQAIRQHKAWLSFDCIGDDDTSRAENYAQLAKVIAECVNDHTLALVVPEEGQFVTANESLVEQLRSPMPLQGIFNTADAPVINIDDSDPRLQEAVKLAKERWPEFKHAFAERVEGQRFTVKAPITVDENTEFIWVNVETISDGEITGNIANEPVSLGELERGSTVTFPEEDVNDWAYTKGDDCIGLFSTDIFLND